MIQIFNKRLGFATNSSSSHSIVMLKNSNQAGTDINHGTEFGWSNFRCSSENYKLAYLAQQLYGQLIGVDYYISMNASPEETQKIENKQQLICDKIENLVGVRPDIDGHVDHESVFRFHEKPSDHTIKMLTKLFKDPRLVILGGNDNGGDPDDCFPEYYENSTVVDFNEFIKGEIYHFKEDGENVIIFTPSSGTKVRFGPGNTVYDKSQTPELVDVKITDYCPYGCEFCYQSSTEQGQHADLSEIKTMIDHLASLQVFEIAIGGGEPTKHPSFTEIIRYAKDKSIIPNFTTFGVDWLKDKTLTKEIIECCGGIGVSVHTAKDLNKWHKITDGLVEQNPSYNQYTKRKLEFYSTTITSLFGNKPQVIAQHVVGSAPMSETVELLNTCFKEGIPLLLLGFKETGFGENYETFDSREFLSLLKLSLDDAKNVCLSVDTAFVQKYPTFAKELNIDHTLYTKDEGKFSCYIDMVGKQIAPSSYASENEFSDLELTSEGILQSYSKY